MPDEYPTLNSEVLFSFDHYFRHFKHFRHFRHFNYPAKYPYAVNDCVF